MTLEEGIIHAEDVARMNHEAAKHLTDEHPTQAEKCEECAREHEQLAEWLKELKAYREKLNCTDCIIDGTDACSRGAGRAVNDEICGDFIPSSSEIPTSCEDAISRQAAIFLASDLKQDLPDDECLADMAMAHNEGILEYQTQLSLLPPVTPQQRTGRWIKDEHENGVPYIWVCSNCGTYHRAMYDYCPSCGFKMQEVEE